MTRLLVHVEGPTEENFVNTVLAPHLYQAGYTTVAARLLGNARTRHRRGGIRHWPVVRQEMQRHLANDQDAISTTMVDFYALPDTWPGRGAANLPDCHEKVAHIQRELAQDFENFCGYGYRFEPFVLLHEFEGLLFSDCNAFASGIGMRNLSTAFQNIRNSFPTPEHINDSPETAPSKRVAAIVPGYQKPLFGAMAALEIGLERMREECPNFHDWVRRLEQRAA